MLFEEARFENLIKIDLSTDLIPDGAGSNNATTVFAAVGLALSSWESLEEELCRLFQGYIDSRGVASARAYGCQTSNLTRLNMLKQVIESKYGFSDPGRCALHTKAMNKIQKLAKFRNNIAHGKVQSPTLNEENRGFFLFPAEYNSTKNHSDYQYFIKIGESAEKDEFKKFFLARSAYYYSDAEINQYAKFFQIAEKDVRKARLNLFENDIRSRAEQGDASVAVSAQVEIAITPDRPSSEYPCPD